MRAVRGRCLVQGRGRSGGGAWGCNEGVQVGGDQVRGQIGVQEVGVQTWGVMVKEVRQREGSAASEPSEALI